MCSAYSDDIITNVWNWKRFSCGRLKQSLTLRALVYIPLPILELIIGPSQCPWFSLTLKLTWSSCFQQRGMWNHSRPVKQGQSLAVKASRHETNRPLGVQDGARRWRSLRSARCRASRSKEHVYYLNTNLPHNNPESIIRHRLQAELFILIGGMKGMLGAEATSLCLLKTVSDVWPHIANTDTLYFIAKCSNLVPNLQSEACRPAVMPSRTL